MIFLACFGDNVQAAAGADFVKDKLTGKNVYLLRDNSAEYTMLLAKYFQEASARRRQDHRQDDYKTGDKSFTAQITKLKALSTKPDVVYVAAMPDDIGLIVKQMRQAGVTPADRRRRRLRHAAAAPGRRQGGQRRLLLDARLHGDRFAPPRSRSSTRTTRPPTAPTRRTPSPRSATTRSASSPMRSSGPVRRIRPRSATRSPPPRAIPASPARSPIRPACRVPQKTVSMIGVKDDKLTISAAR